MPDFRNCITFGGSVYCWDNEENALVKVKITDIPLMEVPEDITNLNNGNKDKL